MRTGGARVIVAVCVALLMPGSTIGADAGSISITTVDGQQVSGGRVKREISGNVEVTGTAALYGSAGGQTAADPLVADAGDSSFVKIGQPAYLVGAGFGGDAPYTFAWSATAGTLQGADGAETLLDTTGLAPGTYTASLTITDSAGATATDTVKVAVYDANPSVLLDQTRMDLTPGTFATGEKVEFPFTVPAGVLRLDVALTFAVPSNDYDLDILDPTGTRRGGSGNLPSQSEADGIAFPEAGTWKAVAIKYATTADPALRVRVTAITTSDPRPVVDTTGPYRFVLGQAQSLAGSITGGTAPYTSGWDTDFDGRIDTQGTTAATSFGEGRHLVTFKVTDANGFERRETTSVFVGTAERVAENTTPLTIVGVADSGINAYHNEFSAETYPDPDVLALTRNFTRHPSEYIPGYPENSQAIPITLDEGYYPAKDKKAWSALELGKLYWIPGTKIIGAYDANDSSAVNALPDATRILDDDGHGSGSSSVSTGNRYGYCPTCLLMFVEGLEEGVASQFSWVDITSHSFGTVGGVPLGVLAQSEAAKSATERGQTVLFAAGNGVGNAFDVPQITWGSNNSGGDWAITVGALRRDNQRAVVGDGIPVHISAWGDGNLPSACRTGTVGQCAFSGTSAATPYTAGVFGTVLTGVRAALGDPRPGQSGGQVVATGDPIPGSIYLDDGALTRAELREAVFKTALPLNTENRPSPYPYPLTAPYAEETNVLFEGYGAATPEGAKRAVDVILGRALVPDRSYEDQFFALDRAVRDTLYGGYDRDGDGDSDSEALAGSTLSVDQVESLDGVMSALRLAAEKTQPAVPQYALGQNALTYYLHRVISAEPDRVVGCNPDDNEAYMDQQDTSGDIEPCFENRATSVVAAFRPLGIFASKDVLDAPIPAGSTVYATLYLAAETPSLIRPTGVLMATDREIGRGEGILQPVLGTGPSGELCGELGEACWTKYDLSFQTTRPAFTGEPLTFQVEMIGARSWAFGFEGAHASKVAIVVADMPASGLDFGVTIEAPSDGEAYERGEVVAAGGRVTFPDLGSDPTGAGDHPTDREVDVSVDDPEFGNPIEATVDLENGTWSAPLGDLAVGDHTVYARARIDRTTSPVASTAFTVTTPAFVEWQVVRKNRAVQADRWSRASGLESWRFSFDARQLSEGSHTIVARLVRDGLVLAQATAQVKTDDD
jgi:hypothetical protein